MSAGHRHPDGDEVGFALNSQNLERLMKMPEVLAQRWKWRERNHDHDLPYLAGYSADGNTLYFDRHLPKEIELEFDGMKKKFDSHQFLEEHEGFEKTLIDALNYAYWPAHKAANAIEKRHVLMVLGPNWWPAYQHEMQKYVKADEHEKLQKIPKDLDLTPYLAPPVDEALLNHLQEKMGGKKLYTKTEVAYTDTRGTRHRRCGPVQTWPREGVCEYWHAGYCRIVRGPIKARGACDKWSSVMNMREENVAAEHK